MYDCTSGSEVDRLAKYQGVGLVRYQSGYQGVGLVTSGGLRVSGKGGAGNIRVSGGWAGNLRWPQGIRPGGGAGIRGRGISGYQGVMVISGYQGVGLVQGIRAASYS